MAYGYGYGYGWNFAPYVSVASRKARAEKAAVSLRKKGRALDPVRIEGRTIARSFWGKAWCRNLERYGDFANRIPRGRSYVANGLVVDLNVAPGRITALVQGSELYEIEISIAKLGAARWKEIRSECAGKIDSLVELLSGRLSEAVMAVVTRPGAGLFPAPAEIRMRCSCPDSARLCKHLAAALYGVGARLDQRPELLFLLREADHLELVSAAAEAPVVGATVHDDALAGADLSAIFGIDLEAGAGVIVAPKARDRREAAKASLPADTPARPGAKPRPVATRPLPARPAPAAVRAKRLAEVRASDLVALGISRGTIQNWLVEGVLERTDSRGVYRKTTQTKHRIEAYLARR